MKALILFLATGFFSLATIGLVNSCSQVEIENPASTYKFGRFDTITSVQINDSVIDFLLIRDLQEKQVRFNNLSSLPAQILVYSSVQRDGELIGVIDIYPNMIYVLNVRSFEPSRAIAAKIGEWHGGKLSCQYLIWGKIVYPFMLY